MNGHKMKIIYIIVLALLASANGTHAQVLDYPNRSIKILVPLAAGSGTDSAARYFGQQLATLLGQSVVIENRPGASGNIGMEIVAKANPDGYTLLFASTNLTLNPAVYPKVPFDPIKDFVAVTNVAYAPMILITRPDFGGDSLLQ